MADFGSICPCAEASYRYLAGDASRNYQKLCAVEERKVPNSCEARAMRQFDLTAASTSLAQLPNGDENIQTFTKRQRQPTESGLMSTIWALWVASDTFYHLRVSPTFVSKSKTRIRSVVTRSLSQAKNNHSPLSPRTHAVDPPHNIEQHPDKLPKTRRQVNMPSRRSRHTPRRAGRQN